MPPITLWFLQASRCIRNAWLLEALGLDYEVKFSPRENGVAPPDFKKKAGDLGKFPTLEDGEVKIWESGAITEYLCDTYDKAHTFLPALGDPKRYNILTWVHAAEGMWAMHAMPILYMRWGLADGGDVEATEKNMSKNVLRDMQFLEETLEKSGGKWIFGQQLTAADFMMHFSARFILARELGTKGASFPEVERWMRDCEDTESYRKAVERTGHQL